MVVERNRSERQGHSTLYIVGAIGVAIIVSITGPTVLGESFRPLLAVFDVSGEVDTAHRLAP
jgi:hypothetical protein